MTLHYIILLFLLSFHRLKKSHLEKKKVEEELKDLQESQPSTDESRALKDVLQILQNSCFSLLCFLSTFIQTHVCSDEVAHLCRRFTFTPLNA